LTLRMISEEGDGYGSEDDAFKDLLVSNLRHRASRPDTNVKSEEALPLPQTKVYDLFKGEFMRDLGKSRKLFVDVGVNQIEGHPVSHIFINEDILMLQEIHLMDRPLLDEHKKKLLIDALLKKFQKVKKIMNSGGFSERVADAVHRSQIESPPGKKCVDTQREMTPGTANQFETLLGKTITQYNEQVNVLASIETLDQCADDYEFVEEYFRRMIELEKMSMTVESLFTIINEVNERARVLEEVFSIVEPSFAHLQLKAKKDKECREKIQRILCECEVNGLEFDEPMRRFIMSIPEVGDPLREFDESCCTHHREFHSDYPDKSYGSMEYELLLDEQLHKANAKFGDYSEENAACLRRKKRSK